MRAPVLAAALVVLTGCGANGVHDAGRTRGLAVEPDVPASITVTSPAFGDGGVIPTQFTCHGTGISPPIQWSGA